MVKWRLCTGFRARPVDDADGHAPVTFCRSGSKMSYARSTVGPSSMLSDRRLSSAVDSAANTPLASPLINSRRDSRELSNGFFRSVIHPSDHPTPRNSLR